MEAVGIINSAETLQDAAEGFKRHVNSQGGQYFQAACGLLGLLKEATSEVTSMTIEYILWDLYRDFSIDLNPFLSVFEERRTEPFERTPSGIAHEMLLGWIVEDDKSCLDTFAELSLDEVVVLMQSQELRLLAKATKVTLTIRESATIGDYLKRDSTTGILSTRSMMRMIEANPLLAYELISTEVPRFVSALQSAELSLNLLEVVNRLVRDDASRMHNLLPREFLHEFIDRIARQVELVQDRDIQVVKVRWVCVFISSLIRNSAINLSDYLVQLQSFTVQFSRVKEANVLYQTLAANAT